MFSFNGARKKMHLFAKFVLIENLKWSIWKIYLAHRRLFTIFYSSYDFVQGLDMIQVTTLSVTLHGEKHPKTFINVRPCLLAKGNVFYCVYFQSLKILEATAVIITGCPAKNVRWGYHKKILKNIVTFLSFGLKEEKDRRGGDKQMINGRNPHQRWAFNGIYIHTYSVGQRICNCSPNLIYLAALPWVSWSTIKVCMQPAKYIEPKQSLLKCWSDFLILSSFDFLQWT